MPRKKKPKVKLHPEFQDGRQIALDRATSLFLQANGDGRREASERVRDELPFLNGTGDFSPEFRDGYLSGTEIALCRILDGEGDPRQPLPDEWPLDATGAASVTKKRKGA